MRPFERLKRQRWCSAVILAAVLCGCLPGGAEAAIIVGSDLSEAAVAPPEAGVCGAAPATCTTTLAGVRSDNPYPATSPTIGTVTAFDVESGGPGTLTFRLALLDQAIAAKVLILTGDGTGPTVTLPGAGTYQFPAAVPIRVGDSVGFDSTLLPVYGGCQSGASSYAFPTLLPDGSALQPSSMLGCEALVNAVVEPSAAFRFGRATVSGAGEVRLGLTLPGPGRLLLRGKGVARVARQVAEAGFLRLPLALAAGRRRTLAAEGAVKVRLSATFTPTGGSPGSEAATVRIGSRASSG